VRIVVALGGNALLKRGEPPTEKAQRENVRVAARALAPLAREHSLIVTHGNGPQVGLLALEAAAHTGIEPYALDVLSAESEGLIGYMIEQELGNILPENVPFATILTQVEVDPADPAFQNPSKPIGPQYPQEEAERLAREHGWTVGPDNGMYRRLVPSPRPKRIFEIRVVEWLLERGVIVICTGGGGIPTRLSRDGVLEGVEAVIDKDYAGALLATSLGAEVYLMLTDAEAVWENWGTAEARAIRRASPAAMRGLQFPAGSMGPKVDAACEFVEETGGRAGIGSLEDAGAIIDGTAGTIITTAADGLEYWPSLFYQVGSGPDVVHVNNITERKQSEQQLRDEILRRRILVEQSSDGIVVLDESGRVTEANQQFARMLGYSMEEMVSLCVWDWDATASKERLREMLATIDVTGDHFETRHRRKDGTQYEVEISTNGAIFGGKKYVFCVCRDITERKQAEREREALIRELQDALAEIKTLRGLVPICSYCSKIRDDKGLWEDADAYIARHSAAGVTHGICPECMNAHFPQLCGDDE
jgi:carbamate kinase